MLEAPRSSILTALYILVTVTAGWTRPHPQPQPHPSPLSLSLSLSLSLTLTLTLALALTRWTPFSAIAYAISEAVTDGEACASTARPWWGYVVEP